MKIVIFSGAGISRESGLKTFRDEDGLWEGNRVEDVCTTAAWRKDRGRVIDFYNARRKEMVAAQPNAAHLALAALEAKHDVSIITQNIDDLHERAGSSHVIHLHGEITKRRSSSNTKFIDDCVGDIQIGDRAKDNSQYRPHVVFFGEDIYNAHEAFRLSRSADILIVVGTSLQVWPASSFVTNTTAKKIVLVDPNGEAAAARIQRGVEIIPKNATDGIPEAIALIELLSQKTP